jgi:hypothetical protein
VDDSTRVGATRRHSRRRARRYTAQESHRGEGHGGGDVPRRREDIAGPERITDVVIVREGSGHRVS